MLFRSPAAVTTTEPPAPVVKVPKPSAALGVCVSVIGETMVAVAVPVAVEVLPGAANAGEAKDMAMAEARISFFIRLFPK